MSFSRKGANIERKLSRMFYKRGYATIRAPASGAKTRRVIYPDLIAIKKGVVLAIEVKYRSKGQTIYISGWQIRRLLEFARRAGAIPLIAIKYSEEPSFAFVNANYLKKTKKGNYKVDREVLAYAVTFEELNRMVEEKINQNLVHSNIW